MWVKDATPLDEIKVETLEKTLREVWPSRERAKREDEKKCARAADEDRYEEEITLVFSIGVLLAIKLTRYDQQRRTHVEATRFASRSVGRLGVVS